MIDKGYPLVHVQHHVVSNDIIMHALDNSLPFISFLFSLSLSLFLFFSPQVGSVLSQIIGHEGPGSAAYYLKKQRWITALSAGTAFNITLFNLQWTNTEIQPLYL